MVSGVLGKGCSGVLLVKTELVGRTVGEVRPLVESIVSLAIESAIYVYMRVEDMPGSDNDLDLSAICTSQAEQWPDPASLD